MSRLFDDVHAAERLLIGNEDEEEGSLPPSGYRDPIDTIGGVVDFADGIAIDEPITIILSAVDRTTITATLMAVWEEAVANPDDIDDDPEVRAAIDAMPDLIRRVSGYTVDEIYAAERGEPIVEPRGFDFSTFVQLEVHES